MPRSIQPDTKEEVYPSRLVLIVIPYYWILAVSYSHDNMQLVSEVFTQGRDKFVEHEKNVMEDMNRRADNP